MRTILFRPRIKRDMEKMARRGKDLEKLITMAGLIAYSTPLPSYARLHKLSGEYEGLWECHIESDWLLIFDTTPNAVILFRTGTDTDLF